jgi:AmmeMemoRadiSam system protein A
MTLSPTDSQYLVNLARLTIARAVEGDDIPPVVLAELTEELQQPGASFVTITIEGALRGCIGSIEPYRPLAQDVQENALGAAFRDPRFPALSTGELDAIQIELSILTQPQPLAYTSGDDLLSQLRPNIDGVIIEREWRRATFLPQVWEKLPNPIDFMSNLCKKAGLPPDDYQTPGLKVSIYQVAKYAEE